MSRPCLQHSTRHEMSCREATAWADCAYGEIPCMRWAAGGHLGADEASPGLQHIDGTTSWHVAEQVLALGEGLEVPQQPLHRLPAGPGIHKGAGRLEGLTAGPGL